MCTVEFATAHSKAATACGTSYIHGKFTGSVAEASNRRGGAEEGMAFLPLAVIASGRLDFENKGRINCWRVKSMMKADVRVWCWYSESRLLAMAVE